MKRYLGLVMAFVLALVFATAGMAASKALNKEEAEALVKGNTVEGVNKFKKEMIWYFDPLGELRKRDNLGNKGKEKWWIGKKGEYCHQDKHMKDEKCAPIIPRDDGGYDVPLPNPFVWKKVLPGNPHNL